MKVPFGGLILVIFLCSDMVSFKPSSFVTNNKTTHVMYPFHAENTSPIQQFCYSYVNSFLGQVDMLRIVVEKWNFNRCSLIRSFILQNITLLIKIPCKGDTNQLCGK